jgi:chromosomal replication initiator protein
MSDLLEHSIRRAHWGKFLSDRPNALMERKIAELESELATTKAELERMLKRQETAIADRDAMIAEIRGRPSWATHGPASICNIQMRVCEYFGLNMVELLRETNTIHLVRPRQIAFYLCHRFTTHSLSKIGESFRRDHTTVLHGIKRIACLREEKPEIDQALIALEAQLNGATDRDG